MKKNIFWGVIVTIIGICGGLWLLICLEKLSGTEFVVLTLGFTVIGLIISFAAEVQEFSIAGNGVKLKELRSKAEKSIEELTEAKKETFRFLLTFVQRDIGFFDTDPFRDERVQTFLKLYENIKKFDLINDLKEELLIVVDDMMKKQFFLLRDQNKNLDSHNYSEIIPSELLIQGLFIPDCAHNKEKLASKEFKQNMIDGVDLFRQLYGLKQLLNQLK